MCVPDNFSHLDMTGKGQAADPLTVNLRFLAACLHTGIQLSYGSTSADSTTHCDSSVTIKTDRS